MPIQHARLGWKPDLPDHRDFRYTVSHFGDGPLPQQVDMTSQCPSVYDQLTLGSCTAHAGCGMAQFLQKKLGLWSYLASRLFVYWNSRKYFDETEIDAGATLRNTMKAIVNLGLPPENLWWYNTAKFAVKPNQSVYKAGLKHRGQQYLRIDNTNLNALLRCLADGYPFIFGISAYESLLSDEVATTGEVPMPSKTETLVGGHALMAVGYDLTKRVFLVRNSWGPNWGKKGYCTLPMDYMTNTDLSDDFWVLRTVA